MPADAAVSVDGPGADEEVGAPPRRDSYAAGIRAGVPFALAGFLFAFSFGVAARPLLGPLPPIVMSALAFAGASQFAALAVLAAGGGALTAIVAGTLVNLRFLPMGIAVAPSLQHGPFGRATRALAIIDPSWVLARRGERSYDVDLMIGATAVQYLTWVGGTVAGVVLGPALGDTQAWGLDAIFPAFMLALLAGELGRPGAKTVALLGAAIAIALTPIAPAGIPIVAASAAALLDARR